MAVSCHSPNDERPKIHDGVEAVPVTAGKRRNKKRVAQALELVAW